MKPMDDKKTQNELLNEEGNASDSIERVIEAPVNPEVTPPCAKLKSVPIPQPLILKRRASKSSISSSDDMHEQHSKHNTPIQANFMDTIGSGGDLSHKKLLPDLDSVSSSGSELYEIPSLTQQGAVSPPPPAPINTTFSPKYSSPPAGSGGKYMVRSKRASWIDGSSSMAPHDSVPTTPTAQTSKSFGTLQKQLTNQPSSDDSSLKSGSLSKLREDRQQQYQTPKRENSLDSGTPLSASSSVTDHSGHSFLLNKVRKHSDDMEDVSFDAKRSSLRERKASVSSIITDSSFASEELYSPTSSPRNNQKLDYSNKF